MPCTEEIAVFRAFADTVAHGEDHFVVIDTAPTGHTLLLLDAAEAYHREVLRKSSEHPMPCSGCCLDCEIHSSRWCCSSRFPRPPRFTKPCSSNAIWRGRRFTPFAWVVNQSLTPLDVTDPVLRARRSEEAVHLRELATHGKRTVLEPWHAEHQAVPDGEPLLAGAPANAMSEMFQRASAMNLARAGDVRLLP